MKNGFMLRIFSPMFERAVESAASTNMVQNPGADPQQSASLLAPMWNSDQLPAFEPAALDSAVNLASGEAGALLTALQQLFEPLRQQQLVFAVKCVSSDETVGSALLPMRPLVEQYELGLESARAKARLRDAPHFRGKPYLFELKLLNSGDEVRIDSISRILTF